MQWDELLGHQVQREWFRAALGRGRLATSFLFCGPAGIGKKTFARLLAKSLLCRQTGPTELECCGRCEDCVQVDANTHPDLLEVSKPADKSFLPIELLIGEREKRMRSGFCHDISLRPFAGERKVGLIDDADSLNMEGANCLLKTLEEPPLNSVLILIGTSLQRQLPTIRSRCQTILFQSLPTASIQELLTRLNITDDAASAAALAPHCHGNLDDARLLADAELRQFRETLLEQLGRPQVPIVDLAKSCGAIADAAGKDNRAKRQRLKLLFETAAGYYRAITLGLDSSSLELGDSGRMPVSGNTSLAGATGGAIRTWNRESSDAVRCWNRCLAAMEQVDRNANQTGLLQDWAADLARLSGR